MRRILCAVVMTGAVAAVGMGQQAARAQVGVPATRPAETKAADVPVKVVVLYSSGVGYFEHFGTVRNSASTELRFKTQQINDILKSLVLQDMDGGRITTITYPSQDPLEKTLRSFQVNISDNPSLGDLLNRLRGAKVTVTVQAEQVQGTILGVEKKQRQVGDTDKVVEIQVLNLLSGAGIRSLELEQVRTIELEDAQLQEELNKALAAVAQARDQDKKPVAIQFMGQGERRVRLGYVVETPIWKSSYRLVLSSNEQEKPKIQGWAIVENQTDNDWNNVQLSLVSGRPISFIQDLYQPLYVPRPVVQPELFASLRPQTYEGGMDEGRKEFGAFGAGGVGGALPSAPAAAAMQQRLGGRKVAAARETAGLALADSDRFAEETLSRGIDASRSIASIASAAKMGELFQYTVGNVSLPRQRSAMIPIITDDIEVERLSIYNAAVLPRNPLNGARLKNTTDKHLLQGPITVLDANAYAGDAKIENLPPGQERLLSYGVDLQMLVNSTANRQENSILSGKIVKGILQISRKHVFAQDYIAENKAEKARTLIIEHPRRQGWHLVNTDKPIETTDALYRFKGQVEPGKPSKLTVQEEVIQGEELAILPCDIGQLVLYARTGQIPKDVRDALAKAISYKQAMVDTQRQIDERQARVNEITQEQNRIRENLRSVASNSEYYTRLMKKLNDQETSLEKFQSEIDTLRAKLNQQREELEAYLANLNVG